MAMGWPQGRVSLCLWTSSPSSRMSPHPPTSPDYSRRTAATDSGTGCGVRAAGENLMGSFDLYQYIINKININLYVYLSVYIYLFMASIYIHTHTDTNKRYIYIIYNKLVDNSYIHIQLHSTFAFVLYITFYILIIHSITFYIRIIHYTSWASAK